MARALITGITGFAGGHLAAHLLALGGIEVCGVAHDRGYGLDHLGQPVPLVIADLRDPGVVKDLLLDVKPDQIFHLAAQAYVPTSWQAPWNTFENNVRPELNILQLMVRKRMKARLLVVASNEVYGVVSPDRLPVDEGTLLEPHNPYGVSKVVQDLLARQYFLSHGVDVIRARAFNHLGPRQSPQFVAANFARQIAEAEAGLRKPVVRVGNLQAQRDFTDVVDVVRAYALLMEKGRSGEAYNIGSGEPRSVRAVLDTLLGMSSVQVRIEPDPARMRPSDIPVIYGDITKLHADTGWLPTIPFEESLARVQDYWREVVRQPGYVCSEENQ
ncbi:MAG: GDP-mannose 4,6-dehydratase [Anaerolineales bacterium]|nr:MAG: GDP-mannose 4,6-dehydratase [Anaerolineales bacterium]